MLAEYLHPLPIATLDRYARWIYAHLQAGTNRPMTLRHLNTLAGYEQEYLVALMQLRDQGKHYLALAALTDQELAELDLDFEIAHQEAVVAELESWESAVLAVILGEEADESLIGLESRVMAMYFV